MSEIKWIKITTDMFDDEKILFIEAMPESDAILLIWIRLLTLAGKSNMRGHIFLTENIPYTDEMLAQRFRKPLNVVRLALETFKRLGMVEIADGSFLISNWEKHQNVEGMEHVRQLERDRKRRQRERQKLLQDQTNVTGQSRDSHADVTQQDLDLDLELDIEIDNSLSGSPPGIPYQDIISYLNEQTGKRFNHKTETHRKLIRARWNEGATLDDFKTVIRRKVGHWKDDPKMEQYLKPDTLFSSKFDKYLNEPDANPYQPQQQQPPQESSVPAHQPIDMSKY